MLLTIKVSQTRLPDGCHRLKLWVEEYEDVDPAIFVYQRYPTLPGENPPPDDRFVNIASAADLEEYPATAPTGERPFFRLTSTDLVFRSVDLLDETWKNIQVDIQDLLTNLRKLEDISEVTEVTFTA